MGVQSVLARLNHPIVWTTVSALAVAGAIYYLGKDYSKEKDVEEILEPGIEEPEIEDPEDPEMAVVGDLNVNDDQEERPIQVQMTMENFSCIAVLGRGSFGKVLLAEYKTTKELFAIKAMKKRNLVNSNSVNRLMCEQRVFELVTKARHPFLINMFASFQTELHTCFVLEYAAGGTVATHAHHGLFSEPRTLFYSACAVLGIGFLHEKNIAHRDIKLSNMLLDSEGYLKITDFGYCKEEMGFRDHAYSLAGTFDYLSPEMIIKRRCTRAADWWSLGVCIYEMLVGETPFYGSNEFITCFNITNKQVDYPNFLSREAVWIINQLTSKDPWRRLGTGPRGTEDVKRHCFFNDIPWDDLLARKIEPPWVPTIRHRKDVSNFENRFTVASPNLTPPLDTTSLTSEEQEMFASFDILYTVKESADQFMGCSSLPPALSLWTAAALFIPGIMTVLRQILEHHPVFPKLLTILSLLWAP